MQIIDIVILNTIRIYIMQRIYMIMLNTMRINIVQRIKIIWIRIIRKFIIRMNIIRIIIMLRIDMIKYKYYSNNKHKNELYKNQDYRMNMHHKNKYMNKMFVYPLLKSVKLTSTEPRICGFLSSSVHSFFLNGCSLHISYVYITSSHPVLLCVLIEIWKVYISLFISLNRVTFFETSFCNWWL